jgi:hypothetical protein
MVFVMEKFRKNWSFRAGLNYREKWKKVIEINNLDFLRKMKIGLTVNLCCGYDITGDVLMDVDFKVLKGNRDSVLLREFKDYVCGDLFHLPFREKVFDTVICDPPFSYYNKLEWIAWIEKLAKKRVILCVPSIRVRLNSEKWDHELYYIETNGLFLRLWWVFTRRGIRK